MGEIPPNFCIPTHQVAGHFHGQSKTKLGLLQTKDGFIYKAIQSPPRGQRELDFYKRIFSTEEENLNTDEKKLKRLLPGYGGEIIINEVVYLKMHDTTFGLNEPLVIDLKIGRVTYDPEATNDKILRQRLKYPPCERTGFQLMGMRIYDNDRGKIVKYDKVFGRSRCEEDLIHCFGLYYQINSPKPQKFAIKEALKKLIEIKKWFEKQKSFRFFASSILIVYEKNLEDLILNEDLKSQLIRVNMIDLTHVFPGLGEIDSNYLAGLNTLIDYHHRLLGSEYSYQDPTIFSLKSQEF